MDFKELRIGNYVTDGLYEYVTIGGIHPHSSNEITICINGCDYGDRVLKEIEPILTSKEWLVKVGFENGENKK